MGKDQWFGDVMKSIFTNTWRVVVPATIVLYAGYVGWNEASKPPDPSVPSPTPIHTPVPVGAGGGGEGIIPTATAAAGGVIWVCEKVGVGGTSWDTLGRL